LIFKFVSDFDIRISDFCYLEPQLEQLPEEQVPQEEPAVLLTLPPTEKAKADIIRFTFLLLQLGHVIFSEELKTNFSKS
jgi:hypothetical protein